MSNVVHTLEPIPLLCIAVPGLALLSTIENEINDRLLSSLAQCHRALPAA